MEGRIGINKENIPQTGEVREDNLGTFADSVERGTKTAKEIFAGIFREVEGLRESGDNEALREHILQIRERYFSNSNDLFSELSLKDNFEILLRVNKIDELQGPIGQAGVGQLVYRLAGFQYGETDRGENEIGDFINSLLENKNTSEIIESFQQIKTLAVSALADGDWAHPVYSAIKKYFQEERKEDIFILRKIKDRIVEGLKKEEEDPTLGIVTTIGNKHGSLMFEENIFDEELNSEINDVFSFGVMSSARISKISRDYLGVFDSRNRLVSLVASKSIELQKIKDTNSEEVLIGINDYYEATQSLKSHRHLFNKTLDLLSSGILDTKKDGVVVSKFAELLGIKEVELVEYLENEKLYGNIQKEGASVSHDIQQKSDDFYEILKKPIDWQKGIELEDSIYDLFNKRFEERKSKRIKIDTLDLTEGDDFGFLGINKENLELFKVLQDPYFTHTIEDTFGVNLTELDIRAQTSFLSFFSKAHEADAKYFSDLISKFNNEDRKKICTAYLSFEEESEFGYIIEKLCERPDIALPVIRAVYELIGNAGKIEDYLLSEFKTGNERNIIASLYNKLINIARDILLKYNAKVMNIESLEEVAYGAETLARSAEFSDEDSSDVDDDSEIMKTYKNSEQKLVEEARQELVNINIGQTLFLNAYRSLKEEGLFIPLEDIHGVELTTYTLDDISESDRATMRDIYAKNYTSMPRLRDRLLASFDEVFSTLEKSKFSTFKHNGVIRGFYRLGEVSPGRYAFGAFNIDPTYQGYRLGEAILARSLGQETKDGVVEGDCNREVPVSSFYIEHGFVGTASFQFEEAPAIHIARNDRVASELFPTKRFTHAEIVASSVVGERVEKNGSVFTASPVSQISSIPFSLLNEIGDDGSRYVLTRSLREKKDNTEIIYAVFEKVANDDFKRLMTPALQEEEKE